MDWLVLRYDGRGTQRSPGGHSGSLPKSKQVLHRLGGSNGMGHLTFSGKEQDEDMVCLGFRALLRAAGGSYFFLSLLPSLSPFLHWELTTQVLKGTHCLLLISEPHLLPSLAFSSTQYMRTRLADYWLGRLPSKEERLKGSSIPMPVFIPSCIPLNMCVYPYSHLHVLPSQTTFGEAGHN